MERLEEEDSLPLTITGTKMLGRAVPANGDEVHAAPSVVTGASSFRLLNRIAGGGFGQVYLAEPDGEPGDLVAVKLLNPSMKENARALLGRELAALRAMHSSRIPRLIDFSLDAPTPFIVLEYFPHGTLSDLFHVALPLDPAVVLRVLLDLLGALSDAHAKGILHLDIKPKNILQDGRGGYVLTDFGIAQALFADSVETRSPGIGTRGFQAPELERGDHDFLDATTDLFGLGATAWYCLTGEVGLPVSSESKPSKASFDSPDPELETALRAFLHRLLQRKRAQRPGSAAEARAMLAAAMQGLHKLEETIASLDGAHPSAEEIDGVLDGLLNPIWQDALQHPFLRSRVVRFENEATLCREGAHEHRAFIVLKGTVTIERGGRFVREETEEGAIYGEVSALAGKPRTATVRARGPVYACMLGATDFERFVAYNPAIAVNLMKSMAYRIVEESARADGKR